MLWTRQKVGYTDPISLKNIYCILTNPKFIDIFWHANKLQMVYISLTLLFNPPLKIHSPGLICGASKKLISI